MKFVIKRRLLLIGGLSCLGLAVVAGLLIKGFTQTTKQAEPGALTNNQSETHKQSETNSQPLADGRLASEDLSSAPEPPPPLRVDGRYLFTGTIVLDRGIEEASRRPDGSLDYQHPFSGLQTYQPQTYNAWLTDLECPISEVDLPYIAGQRDFEFNCLPGYLNYAKDYFQLYNLANNHSANSGRAKLVETRQRLQAAGLQYFGDPEPDQAAACEVLGLPVTVRQAGLETDGFLPVAFCAWHYYHRLPKAGEIEVVEQYAAVMPVFAFVHMGAEYQAAADRVQTTIARRIIEAGAEFVIGNNPHWVQNAELYQGKLIVYSTGNFIFDQAWSDEVRQSANIVVELTVEADDQLPAWLALGNTCLSYADDCLEQARAVNLQPYSFELGFEVIAGYVTLQTPQQVASPAIQAAVRRRLGWAKLFPAPEPATDTQEAIDQ